jgi:hypothetical protein
MEMLDVPSISAIVAAIGVLIGVALTVLELRHLHEQKQTDLLIGLYSRLHSNEFDDAYPRIMSLEFKNYEDFVKRYGRRHSGKSPEIDKAISTVNGFFELVGTLLYRKHIDLGLVYDSLGGSMIKEIWEKIEPLVEGTRRDLNEPFGGAGFEYLYNEIMRKEPQLRKTWAKAILPTVSDSNSPNESSR